MGAATRVTSILAFLITISYSQRVPVANFGFDQILGMMCLYLSLAPCGAAMSIDSVLRRWWRRRNGLDQMISPVRFASARMASRLIQLHLCAIYFWAGFSKLKGPTWWTGEAMWNVIANQEYQTIDLTWMAWTPWLPFLIAHVTIVWEAFFIVLVWNRRLRPLVLAMGTAMHLGIGAFLGMWTFGLIMTFAYLSFADPDIWRTRISWICRGSYRRDSTADAVSGVCSTRTHRAEKIPIADPQPAAMLNSTVRELSSDAHVLAKDVDSFPAAAPMRRVLVIAIDAQHRTALREHFRGHQLDCRAVDSGDRAMHLLQHQVYSAIVVHGSGYSRADLLSLVTDVFDYANIPILVLLAGSQDSLRTYFDQLLTVQCQSLPASLRDIRNSLEGLLARFRRQVDE
jgi:CheY-like chemotaxis protein